MTRHLLVTNDYPPKVGGIQSYLWELWRRLPSDSFAVYTTPYKGADQFDQAQNHHIERSPEPVLLPYPWLVKRINERAKALDCDLIVLDPAVPVGLIGPSLDLPYAVVLHGAEVTVPGRLPVTRQLLNRVLSHAEFAIAAGGYPAEEARRSLGRELPIVSIPPGVDPERFSPVDPSRKDEVRERYGLSAGNQLVLSVSRLVPRKGMDTLIEAAALMAQDPASGAGIDFAIAGSGRESRRLQKLIDRTDAPVRLLGRVPDDDLPALYGAADLFAMLCRSRWGGLEQEGFGIVFLEAAAAGTPQLARRSGGSAEAVLDGVTGRVLDTDVEPAGVADAITSMIGDSEALAAMADASRKRASQEFGYDHLAASLDAALQEW